jgi:hypothetical protein
MTTHELITPPRAPSPPEPWSAAHAASADPTVREMVDEISPLAGVVPVYGPPVVLLAGPWLLLSLALAGPFALALTLVALLVAAAALVGLIGAVLAAPYLLVRRLRSQRAAHVSMRVPAPRLFVGQSQ